MSEPQKIPAKSWFRFIMWSLAGFFWLVIIVGAVLWWGLPRWAPEQVVKHSPWFGPAFEATVRLSLASKLEKRLPIWEPGVSARLLDVVEGSNDRSRRELAMMLLMECKPAPDITPRLVRLLSDPDNYIAGLAVSNLYTHKHPGLIEQAIDALPSLSPKIAEGTANVLARLEPSFALVSKRLLDHPSSDVQKLGCLALQYSREPQAITALVDRLGRYLETVPHLPEYQKDWAAYALGQIYQPAAFDAIETVASEPDPIRRRAAAKALSHHIPRTNHARVRALVIRLIADPDPEVRVIALRKLQHDDDAEAIALLQSAGVSGGHPGLCATKVLGHIAQYKSPAAYLPLIALMTHDDEAIRTVAKEALRGDRSTIKKISHNAAIISLLGDQDPRVQAGAAIVVDRLMLTDEEKQTVASHLRAQAGP